MLWFGRFFTQQRVVPSPWTGSNKSVNLLKTFPAPALTPSILPPPATHTGTLNYSLPIWFVKFSLYFWFSMIKEVSNMIIFLCMDEKYFPVWSQTELSLPPILPKALEEALRPFCTFTQVFVCSFLSWCSYENYGAWKSQLSVWLHPYCMPYEYQWYGVLVKCRYSWITMILL